MAPTRPLFVLTLAAIPAWALNNGLALTPPMGLCTWNLASSDVTEADIKNQTMALQSTGLAAKGYGSMHVDEGWLKGRNATTGEIIDDRVKFPDGMKGTGEWVRAQPIQPSAAARRRAERVRAFWGLSESEHAAAERFTYWLYTSRGTKQCGTSEYSAPGSQGHEKADAQWFADAGADGAKIDSCGGIQDPPQAIADYALWRDSFNATGRDMVFSLCGWKPFYAAPGRTLGNLWRISGDGRSWGPLTTALNHNAYLGPYAGPGGWNDPDLLQGDGSGCHGPSRSGWYQTNDQSRAQMTMWSITAAPLIISASVKDSNQFLLDTWGNDEVIDVNQDPMGVQGGRIWGSDLPVGPGEDDIDGTNAWARPLHDGSWALALLSNARSGPTTVTCGPACLSRLQVLDTSAPPPQLREQAVRAMRGLGASVWGNAYQTDAGEGFSIAPADGFTPVFFADCAGGEGQQFETRPADARSGQVRIVHPASGMCLGVFNCSTDEPSPLGLVPCGASKCGGRDTAWAAPPEGAPAPITSGLGSSFCLDQYEFNSSVADLFQCNGGGNQAFSFAGGRLTAKMSRQCLTAPAALPKGVTFRVRDLWAHKDLSPVDPATDTIKATLAGNGTVAMFRLWPVLP